MVENNLFEGIGFLYLIVGFLWYNYIEAKYERKHNVFKVFFVDFFLWPVGMIVEYIKRKRNK